MNRMTTKLNICSGCKYPQIEGKIFVLTTQGMLCEDCVRLSSEQLALARRRVDAMARVRQSARLLFDLAEPKQPMWHSEADLARVHVLAAQLNDLAFQYVLRRGPFADASGPSVTNGPPDLEVREPPTAPAPTAQDGGAPEVTDLHDTGEETARTGAQESLDDPRGNRGVLSLVPQQPSATVTPSECTVTRDDSRALIERLAAWMRDNGISQEVLAKRSVRSKSAITQFFRQSDRHTSLRFYLDLVRGAGASLRGIRESTPHGVIARFKELIAQQDLSLSALALRASIHRSQVSTVFNKADPNPSLWTVQRLAAALCVEGELDVVALVVHQPPRVVNGGVRHGLKND